MIGKLPGLAVVSRARGSAANTAAGRGWRVGEIAEADLIFLHIRVICIPAEPPHSIVRPHAMAKKRSIETAQLVRTQSVLHP
jgi:hypothetical protein